MSSKSLLSIALFLCINGVLSSKHKHHNKHNKEIEQEDYSSPLADDEQFVDKSFLPKAFFPAEGINKHDIVPTFGAKACCPCAEGLLPTQEAGSSGALPTPEIAGSDSVLPTPESGNSISSDGNCCPCIGDVLPTFEGQALPTPDALDDDAALPTFEALDDPALPTLEGGILPTPGGSVANKNMNVNVNHHNNSSNNSFITKLIIFSVIGVVIAGLYLFYRKYYNNNKYISLSQVRDEEAQYQQFVAVSQAQPAEETTPLIV